MERARNRRVYISIVVSLALMIALGLLSRFFSYSISSTPITKGNLDLSGWDFASDNVKLDGQWEFYWQKLLTAEDFRAGELQPDLYAQVPLTWNKYTLDGSSLPGHGYGTYRLQVRTDIEPGEVMSLWLKTFASAYSLYIDEELVAANGVVADNPGEAVPEFRPQKVSFALPEQDFEIILQVANYHYGYGGFRHSLEFGSVEGIDRSEGGSMVRQIFLTGVLFLVTLIYLSNFVLRPQAKHSLYFAAHALLMIVASDMTGQLFIIPALFPWLSFRGLIFLWYASTCWAALMLALFTEDLFPARYSKQILRLNVVVTIALTLVYIFAPVAVYSRYANQLNFLGLLVFAFILFLVSNAILRKKDGAWLYLLGIGLAVLSYIHDILIANDYIHSQTGELLFLGIIAMIFFLTVVQAQVYTRSYNDNVALLSRVQLANVLKDEFLANTSHQLRTPLNAIVTLADGLHRELEKRISLSQKSNLSMIAASGRKLASLVNDTLDFSKLKRGEISVKLGPVNLKAVAENVLQTFQQIYQGKSIVFISDIPDDLPPVQADENRLYQIFYNLVDNAVKFTAQGYIKISASVGDSVEVTVTDTGRGIAPRRLEHIFTSFDEGDPTLARSQSRVGLGLPITKHLLALQSGTIRVESELNKGSTFIVTFPIAVVDPGQEYTDTPRVASLQEAESLAEFPLRVTGPGPRVLVVDDDRFNLKAIASILHQNGYAVTAVASAQDALQEVSDDPSLAVALLDVMMPVMSGHDLCREIRKHKAAFELPVLMLTARTAARDIALGFDAGANDYLTKPFEKEGLLARVSILVELKESVDKTIASEISFLQAQIKPHFLYNALSVIASLSSTDPVGARELIVRLSEYLRNSFDFESSTDMVPLYKELELVNAYVAIEKARFGQRLNFELLCQKVPEVTIPRLVLQPLVENAIRHGVFKRVQGGTVRLHIFAKPGKLCFVVSDDGVGMAESQIGQLLSKTSKGIGLNNINRRLTRYYSKGLTIESVLEQGTTVSFSVPYGNLAKSWQG